jgi:hypothetical protein
MYALVVTYTSAVPAEQMRDAQLAFAERVVAVPGFVSKTWLRHESTLGGFYVFDSRDAAEAFAQGPLFASLRDAPVVSDLTVREFSVLGDLSTLTGVDVPVAHVT